MKRLGKLFLGMLCIILLFAFSHASAENICAPNKPIPIKSGDTVTFKWEESTNYMNTKPINEEDGKVKYQVYVYKGEEPPNENVDNYKYKNKTEDISYPIKLESPGIYIFGVRAYLFKNNIEVPGRKSDVSWSCDITRTYKNPQSVEVK